MISPLAQKRLPSLRRCQRSSGALPDLFDSIVVQREDLTSGLAAALAPLVRRVLGEETIMDAPAAGGEDGRLRLARAILATA